jgi:hypothetical protein
LACDGSAGPGSVNLNVNICGKAQGGNILFGTGSFSSSIRLTSGSTLDADKTFAGTTPWGTSPIVLPNPTTFPFGCTVGSVGKPLLLYVKNPDYPLQTIFAYPGRYTQLGNRTSPSLNAPSSSISYWTKDPSGPYATGGTITQQGPFINNIYLFTHTFTSSIEILTGSGWNAGNTFTY